PGGRPGARIRAPPRRRGARRAVLVPQPGALRDRLGRARRRAHLLSDGAPLWSGAEAVRPADRRLSARAAEARSHADRDHQGTAPRLAPRAAERRRHDAAGAGVAREAEQRRRGARDRASRARRPRRERHRRRVPGDPPHAEPRDRQHVRGDVRHAYPDRRAGHHGARRDPLTMDLAGKVAVVTGAARGIGRAIAVALADAGCDVAVSDRGRAADPGTPYALASADDLAETARLAAAPGRRGAAVAADVTVAADVERLVREVETRLGGLDVLVANAGIIAAAPVAAMDEAQWDRIFAVNVKGVFLCARAAIPLLAKRGGGRIVNVASLAEELGPVNVAVNALCPGYIETAMWKEVLNPVLAEMMGIPADEVFAEFAAKGTFLRRPQTPEEIADAAAYLCRAE